MSRSDLPGTNMREHGSGLVSYAGKMLGDHGLKSRHRNAQRKLRSAVRPEAA
ncbi:hypothetical protein [Streptomyces sp. SAS_270]|uniref:hypothetical protein n=1 Tax=Streptomyces sp. SAS_270 TaxID=3412748 RepID=UPI00403D1479